MIEIVTIILFVIILVILTITTSKLPERMSNKWLKEKKQDEESWKEIWKELPAATEAPIRIVFGPRDDEFTADNKRLFLDSEWKISATSDRMGYRLEGAVIKHSDGHNIVSDGTVNGSIQVPGNGQPIVLMPDRGTSGGYPKIATVITADLGRFAQISAGGPFRFKAVTMAEAQPEAIKFHALLHSLTDRLRGIDDFGLNIEALRDANVAGQAISAIDVTP